jgi:hypothetical protein
MTGAKIMKNFPGFPAFQLDWEACSSIQHNEQQAHFTGRLHWAPDIGQIKTDESTIIQNALMPTNPILAHFQ